MPRYGTPQRQPANPECMQELRAFMQAQAQTLRTHQHSVSVLRALSEGEGAFCSFRINRGGELPCLITTG